MFLDLRDGPLVLENPPNTLCVIFWFCNVGDLGLAGPDRRRREVRAAAAGPRRPRTRRLHRLHTPTFSNSLVVRALGGVDDITSTRVHPLARGHPRPRRERERRRQRRPLLRADPAGRPGAALVHHPAALRPARIVVRQDLATR
ncbi:hypothetical protein [Actinomycetospora sp. NBC_00405]|uniref:hypothetical protein n=1 Tax=Actinomycetospora sp. NBC_00405 TaxID=2975952 RepID=UPI003FA4761A